MASVIQHLHKQGLIKPPPFVVGGTQYETVMGSVAYGVSGDMSDCDIYGFCVPPKEVVFPHLAGRVHGFGRQVQEFEQFSEHHIKDPSSGNEYDVTIYNIVKFFQLVMENNPNMIDSVFTPVRCRLHVTSVAQIMLDARQLFLHKGAWFKFKGYAYQQVQKMKYKGRQELRDFQVEHDIPKDCTPSQLADLLNARFQASRAAYESGERLEPYNHDKDVEIITTYERLYGAARQLPNNAKRAASVEQHGYDVKFAYHVVRLLNEVEQILVEENLDLERNSEQLKAIRRGEWTLDDIETYFKTKERELESVYSSSKLRHAPDEKAIKVILLHCLEHHYGSLEKAIVREDAAVEALRQAKVIIDRALESSGG